MQSRGREWGVLVKMPITVIEWKARTSAYKALNSIGRCAIYGLEVQGRPMWYAVIYGATGGHSIQEAAQKTDITMSCLIDELSECMKDPICIVGDVNAELDDIPTAWDLLENEGWKDLGKHADMGRKGR